MELNQLKYFYEVAKRGSFSKAAKELRITQPSISKMVKQLEAHEGYTFLDRGKRGVQLTPMGKLLYERCERIFNEFDDLKRSLNTRKEECRGELWFGASDNLSNYLLPARLSAFLKRYPDVQLKLFSGVASEIVQQLKDFRLEVGFFYTPVKESELLIEEIARVEFVLVSKDKLSPRELSQVPFVGSRLMDYGKTYPALSMLKSVGISPLKVIETNQQETQKRLVVEGIGYSLLPVHMVKKELEKGSLRRVSTKKDLVSPIFFARRRNRTLSIVALTWVDFLRQGLK